MRSLNKNVGVEIDKWEMKVGWDNNVEKRNVKNWWNLILQRRAREPIAGLAFEKIKLVVEKKKGKNKKLYW